MDSFRLSKLGLAQMPITPRFSPNQPRVVEILAFPSVQLLDVAGPLQVFASANEHADAIRRPRPYATRVVASGEATVATSAGLTLAVEPLSRVKAPVNTFIVAGGPGVHDASADAALVDWTRARATNAARVASVCTGAFLLGTAGVLDGRRAVTHWSFCAELARRFPSVQVEPDPIFVRDGTVWTSAGVSAGIDLALALVEKDLGRAVSLTLARHLVVFLKRPGGQAQFSVPLSLQGSEDRFDALHDWMGAHIREDLSLPILAGRAGMSERSFSRHYAKVTGVTPARAIEQLRVDAARRLLCEANLPVKRVATRCGFGSEETMRRSFLRLLAVTPQDYRARFGA